MPGKPDHARERDLRRGQTDAEARLWRHGRDRQLNGYKFRRRHRIAIYSADLVCDEARLIVEVDGGQHAANARADAARTRALESAGYKVIRFWSDEVLLQTERVLSEILRVLRERTSRVG